MIIKAHLFTVLQTWNPETNQRKMALITLFPWGSQNQLSCVYPGSLWGEGKSLPIPSARNKPVTNRRCRMHAQTTVLYLFINIFYDIFIYAPLQHRSTFIFNKSPFKIHIKASHALVSAVLSAAENPITMNAMVKGVIWVCHSRSYTVAPMATGKIN